MTEYDIFKGWLEREKVKFTEDVAEDGGVDLRVSSTHTVALITFRASGDFDWVSSEE